MGDGDGACRDTVEAGELEGLGGEGAHDADAAQVLLHHLGQLGELVLEREPGRAQLDPGERGAHADDGHEAQGHEAEGEVDAEEDGGAADEQHHQQKEAQDAGVDPQAHALDIEDAAGHQVAAVDAVVPGEAEGLELAVIGQAQVVADELADRLALVVLQHGEEAAQDAGPHQEERRVHEREARVALSPGRGRAREQPLGLVHRLADELRHEELERPREDGRADGDGHAPTVLECDSREPQQHPGVEARDLDPVIGVRLAVGFRVSRGAVRRGRGHGHQLGPLIRLVQRSR